MSLDRWRQRVWLMLIVAAAAAIAGSAVADEAVCTLADHIISANTNSAVGFCPAGTSHDIITISEDITLTEALPPITGTITIEGGGHTISADGKFRIFDVQEGGQLTIKQLTLVNGNGGRLHGGAVRVEGDARLSIENSAFRNNRARFGGAIGAREQSSVTVKNSRFENNSAEAGGAILLAASQAMIESSSFHLNMATDVGGAIVTYRGEIAINNSTLYVNVASAGGAVYVNGGDVTLAHVTMIDNIASGPEGAALRQEGRRGSLNLHNSIIAGRASASLCSARIVQNVGNLIEDWSCNPEYGGEPKLDLVDGPIPHFVPRDDSPAINAAYRQFCPDRDQIGAARPFGEACDIGAIESTSPGATSGGPVVGVCTLRDRILAANSNQAVGYCPAGTNHDIITITEDITLRQPLPPITGTITIEGGGHTISGDGKFRIFFVRGGNLAVNNLTLKDGFSDDGGGAIQVRNGGWLAVNGSTFIGNSAGLGGGAIDLTGATRGVSSDPKIQGLTHLSHASGLTVSNSSFINNKSGKEGGAIATHVNISISNSSFVDNDASSSGGAIVYHGGAIRITNSTFSGNRAHWGGALSGGGLDVTLAHLTMVDNLSSSRDAGAAIRVSEWSTNVRLRNSIITGDGRGPLCTGKLADNLANFISDGSCSASMSGDALLGELTGKPLHHPPLDGSPLLDAADPRFCPDTDQLGRPRPHGEGCDLGAIESTTALPAPAPAVPPPPCPLALQITAANTDAPAGGCPAGSGHDVITLTEDIVLDAALPSITSEISIKGNGYTISGADEFRLFDVDGGRLTISDLTLRDGDATQGGAIRLINGARVTAANVAFTDNLASYGGAIATESSDVRLDVSASSFVGNQGDSGAGAILVDGGRVNISASAFLGNRAGSIGGAMETRSGYVNVANSTFSDNQARLGGAIFSHGADTTLTHVTLMNNRAHNIVGAGIYLSGTLNLRNSIVAGSGRGDDCYGRLTENRGNLSQDGTCSTAIIADPLLAERTGAHYPLLNASPAHAAADPAFCLPTDQLGNPRAHCDIGAIESERTASEQPPPARVIPADCSLADQIIAANTDAPAGSCPAGQGADIITLGEDIKLNAALPIISSDLTIRGNGHTIDGDNLFRIFDIEHGEVNIKNVTLINGSSPGEHGGAIRARGDADVVVARVAFRNNSAGWGGGIASINSARVNAPYNSFFDNAAEHKGGGLWFNSSECYAYANPMFNGNSSSTHIPDPSREIFTPHVEFGPGVRSRCEITQ